MLSAHNLKGLSGSWIDMVESNVRGLRALGIVVSSYRSLFSSLTMSKMPPEFSFIVSCELSEKEWDLELVMDIFQREIKARKCSDGAMLSQTRKAPSSTFPPSVLSLVTGVTSAPATCTYCSLPHPYDTGRTVREPVERKQYFIQSDAILCASDGTTSTEIVDQQAAVPSAIEGITQVYVQPPVLGPLQPLRQEHLHQGTATCSIWNTPCPDHVFNVDELPFTHPTANS